MSSPTTPTSLLVTRYTGLNSGTNPEGIGINVFDNRNTYDRLNDYHSIYVQGTGIWSAAINYSDASASGPWTSFGSGASITQASASPIASGLGYHPFIQIVVTGSAVASYSAWKQAYVASAASAISFPVSIGQGGTGQTSVIGAKSTSGLDIQPRINFDYEFSAQSPGTSLIAGGIGQVITLAPVPVGVNGTDQNHLLYISGGTGAAEAVLITGGTAVSGSASGTILVTPLNSHTGAWTIQSATAGIQEAIQDAATAGGGEVKILGTATTQAKVVIPSNVCLSGYGQSSIVKIATGAYAQSSAWSSATINYAPVQFATGAINAQFRDALVDTNSANAAAAHIGNVAVLLDENTNCIVKDVVCNYYYSSNSGSGGTQIGSIVALIGQCNRNILDHLTLTGAGDTFTVGSWLVGGIFVQGNFNILQNCYLSGVTDEGYSTNLNTLIPGLTTSGNIWVNNVYIGNSGSNVDAFNSENSLGSKFIGNTIVGPLNGSGIHVWVVAGLPDGSDAASCTHTVVVGNLVMNGTGGTVLQGINVGGLSSVTSSDLPAKEITITGNVLKSESQFGIVVVYNAYNITISDNVITDTTQFGILMIGNATYNPHGLVISDNQFYNCGQNTAAIYYLQQSTSGSVQPGSDITITGNMVYDTRSPKLTTYALQIQSSQAGFTPSLIRWIVKGNNFYNVLTGPFNGANIGSSTIFGPNVTNDVTSGQYQSPLNTAAYLAGGTNTLTLPNGASHNLDIGNYHKIRLFGPTVAFSIGGFTGGTEGRMLFVWNVASQPMTIVNGDASSSLGNRIQTNTGADVTLRNGPSAAIFIYDATSTVWVLMATN